MIVEFIYTYDLSIKRVKIEKSQKKRSTLTKDLKMITVTVLYASNDFIIVWFVYITRHYRLKGNKRLKLIIYLVHNIKPQLIWI